MSSVDQQVRDFYRRQRLAPSRTQELLAAARRKRRSRQRRILLAVAALLTLCVGAVFLHSIREARALGDRVAAEVAMNHRKDLGVEIEASSYGELAAALDKLPFSLKAPDEKLCDYDLVGGRYCSIQAQLAAQLKVHDETGRTLTLYVTELTPALSQLSGTRRQLDDVTIELWAERGLLFALAKTRLPGLPG